jgi:MFS family permease
LIIDDYGKDSSEAGKITGNLGFYASIASIMAELVMGSIMDTFGRKSASVIGMLTAGLALIFMPIGTFSVFPYLYIMRILQTVGLVPLINSPLWLDYVNHKSMGVMASWINMIATVSSIMATTGTLVLQGLGTPIG